MAHVDITVSYNLNLTSQEFRLIGLALAGTLGSSHERRAAAELNEKLLTLRAKFTEQHHAACVGALERAVEARVAAGGEPPEEEEE